MRGDLDLGDPAYIAGERYRLAVQTIRGGDAVTILANHITWMLGDNEWHRPIWRERAVPPDGKTFQTASFDQYLLLPAREGLGMPSLLTVRKLCEADPRHGAKAIDMLQAEIPDYDQRVAADRREVLDGMPELAAQPRGDDGRFNRSDNITTDRGTSASYLARRLQRDFAGIWREYMAGKHRSVRAAAIAAGIVVEKTTLDKLLDLWRKATLEEQNSFKHRIND